MTDGPVAKAVELLGEEWAPRIVRRPPRRYPEPSTGCPGAELARRHGTGLDRYGDWWLVFTDSKTRAVYPGSGQVIDPDFPVDLSASMAV